MHPPPYLLTLLSLSLLAACQAPHVPESERTGCHPACPGAGAARVPQAGVGLHDAHTRPVPAHEMAAERAPSTAAYLCPMHLHVGAEGPGRCPECNMTLVPRAQALEHDHEQ